MCIDVALVFEIWLYNTFFSVLIVFSDETMMLPRAACACSDRGLGNFFHELEFYDIIVCVQSNMICEVSLYEADAVRLVYGGKGLQTISGKLTRIYAPPLYPCCIIVS